MRKEEQIFSKIGTPKKNIDFIMKSKNPVYTPYVPLGIKKYMDKIDIKDIDIFDEEKQRQFEPTGNLPMKNLSNENLERVEIKLSNFFKNLLQTWNQRQQKTNFQEFMLKVFGKIHDNTHSIAYFQSTLNLLKSMISTIPPNQSEDFDATEGFMKWNEFWKIFVSTIDKKSPIKIVHLTYEAWVNVSKGQFEKFKELFENCTIRGASKAACDTVGSVMKIHAT